jgi:hypothetical protein
MDDDLLLGLRGFHIQRTNQNYIFQNMLRSKFSRALHCFGHGRDLDEKARLAQVIQFASTFTLPLFPRTKLSTSYVRSSGPGGQNVNKVSTKAQCSFHLANATWIPISVREIVAVKHANRINKKGEIAYASDRNRTQMANYDDCVEKIWNDLMFAI